jgi:hypothetical protein
VRLVQLRNLTIDPEVLLPRIPAPRGAPMGMRAFVEKLRREAPEVEVGNFTRPIKRAAPLPLAEQVAADGAPPSARERSSAQ